MHLTNASAGCITACRRTACVISWMKTLHIEEPHMYLPNRSSEDAVHSTILYYTEQKEEIQADGEEAHDITIKVKYNFMKPLYKNAQG
jgi:hypothetical protein